MTLTPTDLDLIRDEVGDDPDDTTLATMHTQLGRWRLVAIRVLRRRLAAATAGGRDVESLTISGVMSVGFGKGSLSVLQRQIDALVAADDADQATPGEPPSGVGVLRRRTPR